jgi:starch synthase
MEDDVLGEPADGSHAADAVRCLTVSAPFSGIEVWLRNLLRVLSPRDDIDVVGSVWLQHRPTERLSRIPPLSLHWALAAWWSTTRQLRSQRRRGVDAEVLFFNHLSPLVLLGRTPRRRPVVLNLDATPRLTTAMGSHYLGRGARPTLIERVKVPLYRAVYRRAAHIVAWSRLVERSLVDDYGVDPARVTVVPNGIDLRMWKRTAGSAPADTTVRVLFVGGEFERKGGLDLLATARLPEHSTVEFHIVTKSDVRDASANVVVHRDLGPKSDALRELYASASIFVLPTMADFSPLAVCEAMAMELPVISTAVGAVEEMIEDGVNGFVIGAGDTDALRARLGELIASPDLRRRMGSEGRAIAERSFDIEENADRIVAVLRGARHRVG